MKKTLVALSVGLGAGAGLMYLLDPRRGGARRGRLTAEASALFHRDEKKVEKLGKDILNRMRGVVSKAASVLSPEDNVSDEVLAERVRSHVGHVISDPREIKVHAANGVIRLEGNLSQGERRRLHKEIESIAGVRCVHAGLISRFPMTPGILVGLAAGISLFRRTRREALRVALANEQVARRVEKGRRTAPSMRPVPEDIQSSGRTKSGGSASV